MLSDAAGDKPGAAASGAVQGDQEERCCALCASGTVAVCGAVRTDPAAEVPSVRGEPAAVPGARVPAARGARAGDARRSHAQALPRAHAIHHRR